jgi:hypothetical protein
MIYTLTTYYSGDQLRRIRWSRHLAHAEEKRGAYRNLVGKPNSREPLRIPKWVRARTGLIWLRLRMGGGLL